MHLQFYLTKLLIGLDSGEFRLILSTTPKTSTTSDLFETGPTLSELSPYMIVSALLGVRVCLRGVVLLTHGLMDSPRLFIATHRHVGAPFTEWLYPTRLYQRSGTIHHLYCYVIVHTHCTPVQIGFCLVKWRGSVYVRIAQGVAC